MTLRLALCLGLLTASAAHAALPSTPVEVQGTGTHPIAVIEAPAVSGEQYAVTGSVAYEGVGGVGYLEMWSVFADGSRYFSRTLDESGALAKLSGSSPARGFVLPFFLGPDAPRPVRLELDVVLPAGAASHSPSCGSRPGRARRRVPARGGRPRPRAGSAGRWAAPRASSAP